MPQSLANILVHLVFSTKDRRPLIRADIQDELARYLACVCRACGWPAHGIGGTANHVHVVCSLSRTITVSDMLEEIKKRSSKWIKTKGGRCRRFAWQGGYAAFSIGQSQLPALKRYIAAQGDHHRRKTFQEELRALLKKYQVEYDGRYVWD